jgi:hypothetical protein
VSNAEAAALAVSTEKPFENNVNATDSDKEIEL